MAKKKEDILTMENLQEVVEEAKIASAEEVEEIIGTEEETEEVYYVDFDPDSFDAGIKIGSRLAGIFLALTTAGMDKKDAADLVANERTIEHNIEIVKINGKPTAKVDLEKEVTIL